MSENKVERKLGSNLGIYVGGDFALQPSTTITSPSLSGGAQLSLELLDLEDGYSVGGAFGMTRAAISGKLLPSCTTDGTCVEDTMTLATFSLGTIKRKLPEGVFTGGNFATRTFNNSVLGIGNLVINPKDREVGGAISDYEKKSTLVLKISQETGGGAEFRLGAGSFSFIAEGGLRTGITFDWLSDDERPNFPYSHMGVEVFVRLRLGKGDNSSTPGKLPNEVSLADNLYQVYSDYFLGTLSTYGQYKFVLKPTAESTAYLDDLDPFAPSGGESGIGGAGINDVGYLQATQSFMGSNKVLAHMGKLSPSSNAWRIALPILEGARSALYFGIGHKGEPGDSSMLGGGLHGLNTTATMTMTAAGVDNKPMSIARAALGAVSLGLGLILGRGNGRNEFASGLASSGYGTLKDLWDTPNPYKAGSIKSGDLKLSVWSAFSGGGQNGGRGIIVQSLLPSEKLPHLLLSSSLSTPALNLVNAGKRVAGAISDSIDGGLTSDTLPTTIRQEVAFVGEAQVGARVAIGGEIGAHLSQEWSGASSSFGLGVQGAGHIAFKINDKLRLLFGGRIYLNETQHGGKPSIEFVPVVGFGGN